MNENLEEKSECILPKAMIFAAGLGTRMKPITNTIPKPLVKIHGKALIDYNLDRLQRLGVKEVVVNVHYFADQIEQHLSHRTSPKIHISDERNKLLDTGGGFMKALPVIGTNPLYLLNSDNIWIDENNASLAKLSASWDVAKMDMLLLLATADQNYGYFGSGDFVATESGQLRRKTADDDSALIYTGVAIIKPRVFEGLVLRKFSLNQIFDTLIENNKLFGVQMSGRWYHIGTPEVIDAVADEIMENAQFCMEENIL